MKKIYSLFLVALFTCSYASAQIPTYWQARGIGGGGSLFFPTINPANDNEFYVACDMSELFHSTDYGLSYSPVNFTKIQAANTSTYQFTNDANIAYCTFNDGNNTYPIKTTDGGGTWSQINAYDLNNYGDVSAMSINYNNPLQLLINSYGDIQFSSDGGTSFSSVRHALNWGAGLVMGGVLWNGANIYIGTTNGLIYSSNSGASFSTMTTTGMPAAQQIWSFAGGTAFGTTRFVCLAADTVDIYNGIMPYDIKDSYFGQNVYVMDNASGTWTAKSTGINFSNDHVGYVAMAWNDINTIYLGGKDAAHDAPLVFKSADGGSTWTKVFNTTGNANIITGWEGSGGDKNFSWDEDCFGISVAPNNSNKVMFGNFGDVQLTSDGGTTWRQAYVSSSDQHAAGTATPTKKAYHSVGLENTSCWQVFWEDANKMMGGYSDIGGIRSLDAGASWGFQYSGFSVNSLYRVVKGNNGTMFGACSGIHDIYQSTHLTDATLDGSDGSGKIIYSNDSGATWATLHSFGHPVFWLAIDPNNQNRMYASVIQFGGTQGSQTGGIYMSNDLNNLASATWTKLANPPRTEGHPASIIVLNDGSMICTFSGRKTGGSTFSASSGVFIYNPTTSSWTDVSTSNTSLEWWTKDIIMDPNDATQNTWYACLYSAWGNAPSAIGGLYKTINRGTSWTKLTASQFDRVESITFSPNDLNQAFLTTETQGLWVSTDMNNATPTWNLVPSYPFRQPERVYFNPFNTQEIWVTSFGNGIKLGNANVTGVSFGQQTADDEMTLFPNPSRDRLTISSVQLTGKKATIEIYNMLGEKVDSRLVAQMPVSVDISSLAEGLYIINIYVEEQTFRKMFVKE